MICDFVFYCRRLVQKGESEKARTTSQKQEASTTQQHVQKTADPFLYLQISNVESLCSRLGDRLTTFTSLIVHWS